MSPAQKIRDLQQEDFDRMLGWLDPDRERAGVLYEKIRWRLIAILASRGCELAEELADETIDRVSRKVTTIAGSYVGDPAIYFLGVMNNVHHEYLKRPSLPRVLPHADAEVDDEKIHICLDRCLEKLTPHARQLIEQYYAADKSAKISLRRRIARDFGIAAGTLRLRALRIRARLQECIQQCMELAGA